MASPSGDAGGLVAPQDGEAAAGDRPADAFGPGGGGERSLHVGRDQAGAAVGSLELLRVRAHRGELLVQAGAVLRLLGGVAVAQDGVGVTVQTLARGVALHGLEGERAARAEADGRGAGQAVGDSYDAPGVRGGGAVGGTPASVQLLAPLWSTHPSIFTLPLRKSRCAHVCVFSNILTGHYMEVLR